MNLPKTFTYYNKSAGVYEEDVIKSENEIVLRVYYIEDGKQIDLKGMTHTVTLKYLGWKTLHDYIHWLKELRFVEEKTIS